MADLALEEFQRRQSQQISRDIIAQSEQQQQRIQANAHKLWQNAHEQLIRLLRILDQDFDEAYEKGNHPLDNFNDDDLAYLILIRIRSLKQNHFTEGRDQNFDLLRNQIKHISTVFNETDRQRKEVLEKNRLLLQENKRLSAQLAALRVANPKKEFPEGHPDLTAKADQKDKPAADPTWVGAWKQSVGFEMTSTAIQVMGSSGKFLRTAITKEMAAALKSSAPQGSLEEAIRRLIDPEQGTFPPMVEKIVTPSSAGSSFGGNLPEIIKLTDAGKLAYQLITNQSAVENEYDRWLHQPLSPEHILLNIQASEILEEAGYTLKSPPPQIQLLNGTVFTPDIAAVDRSSGETIFIEVEPYTPADQAVGKQKWINFYEASKGNLFVFCDHLACQRSVQAQINIALNGLNYSSALTNLQTLKQGKRSEHGSIWLSGKQKCR